MRKQKVHHARRNSKPFSAAEGAAILHSYFDDVLVDYQDLGPTRQAYPHGFVDADVSDTLHGRRFRLLIKEGRRRYDMIVIVLKPDAGSSEVRIEEMVEIEPTAAAKRSVA